MANPTKKDRTIKKVKAERLVIPLEKARIVLRFRDLDAFNEPERSLKLVRSELKGDFAKLEKEFGALEIEPVFKNRKDGVLEKLVKYAREKDSKYVPANFNSFFYVETKEEKDLVTLVEKFLKWELVENAYIDKAGPDPVVNASDDPRSANQGYLDAAPDGIDAEYAWGFVGGDGAGQRFIDLERGWTLNHEDITAHGGALLHGNIRDNSRSHGTSVLGEVCAVDNALGCVGIVPNVASFDVVSYWGSTRPDAIIAAIDNLAFGDVLLLEAQVSLNGTSLLGPIEAYDAEYEAIRLATALGVIVVEAGGNGTNNGSAPPLNMDTYTTLSGEQIFNPASPDFRDSGAIIVSAATSTAPHTRLVYGPHGSRIDCYAWSENVDTLRSSSAGATSLYTSSFSGTSSASPIITGAALAVQGIVEAQLGYRLGPLQMRALLSDPLHNTLPSATETTEIGVMPNLREIIDNILNIAPDIYIRDNVGDTGEPHSGGISASPDIIIVPSAVADPQATYGAGSGTENSSTLGYEVEFGQDNYIYTRVLNQGGSDASDVEVRIFWSPVSSLVTPDMWTEVGSTTITNVPAGEILTVSDAIVWHSADIPAEGHYCLVGLIGTPDDPAPNPADFVNFDNYRRFIRENNNVTWRNFNVVDNDPDVSPEPFPKQKFKALDFVSPGIPEKAVPMQLEVHGKLPKRSRVLLEVPHYYADILKERGLNVDIKNGKRTSFIPVKQFGRHLFQEVLYPAKIKNKMRLLVQIPEEYRKKEYQISVRQLFEEKEVGRVTWHLTSEKKKPFGEKGFQIYQDKAGEYRWRLLASKDNIVADSGEGYKNREECTRDIELVKRLCAKAELY